MANRAQKGLWVWRFPPQRLRREEEKAAPDGRVQPSAHDHSEKVKTAENAAETSVQGW